MLTAPEEPEIAEPVVSTTAPEFPSTVVPLENSKEPLEPEIAVFALRIITVPDDDETPWPL